MILNKKFVFMNVIKYTANGITGNVGQLTYGSVIIEIVFAPKLCKYEDRNIKYENVCKYLEQFASGKKVSTDNVISEIETEMDTNEVIYVKRVLLQVTIN